MELVVRTDAKNINNLIRKNKLILEGTTEKMCMVSGTFEMIKKLKNDLDVIDYKYFDYKRKK